MQKKLIVIGGGAAGFFCAINAAILQPELQVLIVEKTTKVLQKVKISGGGRCNVTHACTDIEYLLQHYPRGKNFLKKLFYQFGTAHTISWFAERGVLLKTESDGRMFPITDNAQTIIDTFIAEINRHQVQLQYNTEVKNIRKEQNQFCIETNQGMLIADYICIASGGYPKSFLFDWIKSTGHSIETPVPSLFTFNMPGHSICALMGVSVSPVHIQISGSNFKFQGPILITHWGLSGPAVLKLSAWAARLLSEKNYQFNILINWIPDYNTNQLQQQFPVWQQHFAKQKINGKNPLNLPNRLWQYFLNESAIPIDINWASLTAKQKNTLIQILTQYSCKVMGKTTYKEEFVTSGGIKLSEINAATMESRLMPGLFFAGEITDVDGVTGGFNFQYAWSSSYVAAKSIAESIKL